MSVVGQPFLAQPFLWVSAGQDWAFPALAVVAAAIGLIAAYWLARRLVSLNRAALAVITLIVFTGFWVTTTSFMTDVPAIATELVCLALGAAGLSSRGSTARRWFIVSLAAGCIAFSIREFGLAAPVAVIAACGVPLIGRWAADEPLCDGRRVS